MDARTSTRPVAEWLDRLAAAGLLVAEVKDYARVVADPLAAESGILRAVGDGFGVASPVRLESTARRELHPRTEVGSAVFGSGSGSAPA